MAIDDFEKAAGGLDFEESGGLHGLGSALFEGGPDAFLEQLEEMIPETWREQIASYPITAVSIGFGV
ncbi:MAG: hypothetical protein R3338_02835, partial [Thermoanaerobaculia bacterium]|nr:hypothetical protein [Thermoanaerobaculia bacterium]